ncbi:DTW domain-containing protein [Parasitella parasitica]|nr:DTW domain-containing protein [Parasitella parasitica]
MMFCILLYMRNNPLDSSFKPYKHCEFKPRKSILFFSTILMTQEGSKKRDLDQTFYGPFDELKIADDQVLKDIEQRTACPTCKKTVKYFCYICYKVVGMERSSIPSVKLPVHLDVIKHHKELDGKSTAIHARIIAPDDVEVHTWPQIPAFENPERTLLLFPGPNAKKFTDLPRESFDKIVVIDGTWAQAKQITKNTPILNKMQQVTVAPRKTYFWRFQNVTNEHLATIEATYYLYREFGETFEAPYSGQYDNLLYYYKFFYNLIQNSYQSRKSARFNTRHQQKDYIKYKKEEVKTEEEKEGEADKEKEKN